MDLVERLRAERDFLLARARAACKCSFGEGRWTGMSSNALVDVAFGGENGCLPMDAGDLAACYRTVMRLPDHLRTEAVMAQLAKGERAVGSECVQQAREFSGWQG